MESVETILGLFRDMGEIDLVQIAFILLVAWVLLVIDQRLLPSVAQRLPGRLRVHVFALIPTIRLLILVGTAVLVVRRIIEPTAENTIAIFGLLGVGLGFALKEYATSLLAGTTALYEMSYRPGDWITVDGVYGEVKSLEFRAVHIVTPDDTLVIIPHRKLWDSLIHNANSGSTKLQCVARFWVDPNHDGAVVRRRLKDVALTSPYTQLRYEPVVVSEDTPWGSRYRIRAYPMDPAQQFLYITDLTERGRCALGELGITLLTATHVPADGKNVPRTPAH